MADILYNNLGVIRFLNSPVPSNAYLVVCEKHKRCFVVDPGTKEQNNIRDYVQKKGYSLDYIMLTHEHFDHCWGVNSLLDTFNAKVVTTRLCSHWIKTPMNYFNKLYFNSEKMYSVNKVDVIVEDVDMKLEWNDYIISFIAAKGHTNRGMCISVSNALFTGDTMIYKTKPFLKKKYGASIEDLKKTIDFIYEFFDNDIIVYPGHGEKFQLIEMQEYYKDYFAGKYDDHLRSSSILSEKPIK
ncbi:MBL fold metallo-hydrolase [Parabacteroides faecis]|uniref:Glyoxylase-like metal-dependent hydrolase (Beta-lactamase superfamily II) n=1 Tax=Parabacteroides faecis TaxID=1217282 RepID=A0ABR6KLF7_9BACT|nr:MBL fold metallo-hydrolase [Parabacteroides faecis]MBB4622335.1 glyoxylase-like metal-dependent hydrolase (beta-lactamase superfamily II) [Parabacteroides faecis]GGK11240.1 MBL fold metallo-hydrolase [Parabacteroides faecis]